MAFLYFEKHFFRRTYLLLLSSRLLIHRQSWEWFLVMTFMTYALHVTLGTTQIWGFVFDNCYPSGTHFSVLPEVFMIRCSKKRRKQSRWDSKGEESWWLCTTQWKFINLVRQKRPSHYVLRCSWRCFGMSLKTYRRSRTLRLFNLWKLYVKEFLAVIRSGRGSHVFNSIYILRTEITCKLQVSSQANVLPHWKALACLVDSEIFSTVAC